MLLKAFYIQLYDDTHNCPVASFELLKKGHQWANGKAKRQEWKADSVKNSLFDDEPFSKNTIFERGHFVRHGNWNCNKKMVSEMSVMTNAFPQVKEFKGYMDAEEFGSMLSRHIDAFIITCPIDKCERVVKVFLWTTKSSTVILPFSFPNTEDSCGNLPSNEKRFGGSFITNRSILRHLPFEIENVKDAIFIQEEPLLQGKWKQQIIKSIGKDA